MLLEVRFHMDHDTSYIWLWVLWMVILLVGFSYLLFIEVTS